MLLRYFICTFALFKFVDNDDKGKKDKDLLVNGTSSAEKKMNTKDGQTGTAEDQKRRSRCKVQ